MRAIEAGRDAGGQHGGQRSAAIYICETSSIPWSTSAQMITTNRSSNFAVYTTCMCRAFPIIAGAPQIRRSVRSANGESRRVFNKKKAHRARRISKKHGGFASGRRKFLKILPEVEQEAEVNRRCVVTDSNKWASTCVSPPTFKQCRICE